VSTPESTPPITDLDTITAVRTDLDTITASVFIATSLDGFIARPDGDLSWLDRANATVPPGTEMGFEPFLRSIDVLVMGRASFEKVLTLGPWPYGDTRVVVLTRRPLAIDHALARTVSASSEEPAALCERLAAEGARRLYVDGGVTVQRFLAAGLIDDLTITVIPVVLGAGLPLFGPVPADVTLRLVDVTRFDFGYVQLRYRVVR
jgi:dihydrofolate reductase